MIDKTKKWLCCAVQILRDCELLPKAVRKLFGKKGEKFSPIKTLPRGPGRSAWIKYLEITFDTLIPIIAVLGIALGAMFSMILPAGVVLIVAIFAVLFLLVVFCRQQLTAKNWLLGSQGEKRVAFWLDRVGRPDWRVIHDFRIAEGKSNIDHIVVSLKGVFCIETKTLRKKHGNFEKIRFEGGKIYRGDRVLNDPDPVEQTKRNAKDLHEFIDRKTGENVFVKRVIVFPEWFVTEGTQMGDTTVTNHKLLWRLEREKDILTPDQVSRIAEAIESENEFRVDE